MLAGQWKRLRHVGIFRYCTIAQERDDLTYLHAALRELDERSTCFDVPTWVHILRSCGKLRAVSEGKRFHEHIRRPGLDKGSSIGVPLLNMYCKVGSVENAKMVFDRLAERSVVAWTMIIGAYAQSGHNRTALSLFKSMQLEGVRPSEITFITALTACSSPSELADGEMIHSLVDETNITSEVAVGNTLVSMYGKCGSLEDARSMFYSMPVRDSISWGIVISACSRYEGCESQVLSLIRCMLQEGFTPNNVTLAIVLHACARIDAIEEGGLIHRSMVQRGTKLHDSVGIALVNLYGRCGRLEDALDAFNAMQEHNVIAWNSMMTVFIQTGHPKRAVRKFREMFLEGVKPTKVSYVTILNACTTVCFLSEGRFIHSSVAESGYLPDVAVANALINMYDACGGLTEAEAVFGGMKERDTICWNAMISAYVEHGQSEHGHRSFRTMMLEGVTPNRATLVLVLNACKEFPAVRLIHGYIRERGDESHGILGSALVNMHGKYGTLEEARRIFKSLESRDIVAWNGMIGACVHRGNPHEAWEIYQELLRNRDGATPNIVTYVAVLEACTSMVDVHRGREVHAAIDESLIKSAGEIGVSLIHLYGKCGKIHEAKRVFDIARCRDVVVWSSMITSYSQLGYWEEALDMVKVMQQEGVEPNHVTYLSVISACSHAGLVEEAYMYLLQMRRDSCIVPSSEHYRCVVDLLARAGQLGEAEKLLSKIDMGPLAWMTLLAACKDQGDVDRARRAAKLAIKLNPGSSAGYIAMFNTVVGVKLEEFVEEEEQEKQVTL